MDPVSDRERFGFDWKTVIPREGDRKGRVGEGRRVWSRLVDGFENGLDRGARRRGTGARMARGGGSEDVQRDKREKQEVPMPSKGPCNGKGSSQYRGVAQHRITRRWESHIWNNKRQVYLGSFETEEQAAEAYDKAAICLKAGAVPLNFGIERYDEEEVKLIRSFSKEELVAHLRRGSNGFCRGKATYRGVSWRPNTGRWEARISGLVDKKYTYLGTFDTSEAAAEAYDRAAILCKGRHAITNFDISRYEKDLNLLDRGLEDDKPTSLASLKGIIQAVRGNGYVPCNTKAGGTKHNTNANKDGREKSKNNTKRNTKLRGRFEAPRAAVDLVALDSGNFGEQGSKASIDGTLWHAHASPKQTRRNQQGDCRKRDRSFRSPQRSAPPTRLPDGQWVRSMQLSTPGTSYTEPNLPTPHLTSPMPLPKDLFPTAGMTSPLMNMFDTPKQGCAGTSNDPGLSLSFKELLELQGNEEGLTPGLGRSNRSHREIYQQLFPETPQGDQTAGILTNGVNGNQASLADLSNLNLDFLDSVIRNHSSGRLEWDSPVSKKEVNLELSQ